MFQHIILVLLLTLTHIHTSTSSTSLIGFTFEVLEETVTTTKTSNTSKENPCIVRRCDAGACPCGCECGNLQDPCLCKNVPKQFKKTIKYNQLPTNYYANNKKPNGIVSVDSNTGAFTKLYALPLDALVVESAYDATNQIFWMLQGSTLLGWDQKDQKLLPSVEVDISQCSGGSICFSELRWDSKNGRIVAVGVGFGGPQIAIIAIDIHTGSAKAISPPISINCALYLQCSAFDSVKQVYYPWLACGSTPTATLYAIDLISGKNTTMLNEWNFRDVLGPSNFVQGVGVVTIAPDNSVVRVNNDNTTSTISKSLKAIPSSNGLASSSRFAFVSLVDYTQNKLATVDLTSGNISLIDIPFNFEGVHIFID